MTNFFAAGIDVTNKCTLRCLHCFNSSGGLKNQRMDEMSDEELERMAYDVIDCRPVSICMCGGEPLLRKESIYKIANYSKNTCVDVNMVTNGELMTKEIAKKLWQSGISIDAINDAINTGKQISFQYYDYTGLKKKVLKNKGEVYKLSPYKLLWCGDYYYVLGYSEKKSKVINFRVDRIASKPEILDKDIIPMPDDFDIENYTKEVFFMFSGEKVLVDLRCDNSLMKTMVDRFGEDVTTLAYDMTSFRVQTEVSASPTFFGWVFGFNGKVQILAPESVKEQYKQMIAQADEGMQEKGNKEQEM